MRMTATVSARLNETEVEAFQMLRAKGISTIHIFRRGLDAYLSDMIKDENGKNELTKNEA